MPLRNTQRNLKAIELELMNFISAFMKEKVGRGPRDVRVKMVDNTIIIFIIGILSPLEKNILHSSEGERIILEGRKLYLKISNPERIGTFEKIVNAKVIEHYESLNLSNETAIAVFVLDQSIA
jgi:uncharacterized protein YbcI